MTSDQGPAGMPPKAQRVLVLSALYVEHETFWVELPTPGPVGLFIEVLLTLGNRDTFPWIAAS